MTTQESEKIRDELWTEIRQLVLDDGPVVKAVDAAIAEHDGFPPEDREAFVATVIAERCAEIARMADGPFQGLPVGIVMGTWAGRAISDDLSNLYGGQS